MSRSSKKNELMEASAEKWAKEFGTLKFTFSGEPFEQEMKCVILFILLVIASKAIWSALIFMGMTFSFTAQTDGRYYDEAWDDKVKEYTAMEHEDRVEHAIPMHNGMMGAKWYIEKREAGEYSDWQLFVETYYYH